MGQDYGAAQPIIDAFSSAEQKFENLLIDPKKNASKPNQMKDIPADNPNRKAWEAATTYQGPAAKTAPKKATRKPARKR
jgi:hypothetical protein